MSDLLIEQFCPSSKRTFTLQGTEEVKLFVFELGFFDRVISTAMKVANRLCTGLSTEIVDKHAHLERE